MQTAAPRTTWPSAQATAPTTKAAKDADDTGIQAILVSVLPLQ